MTNEEKKLAAEQAAAEQAAAEQAAAEQAAAEQAAAEQAAAEQATAAELEQLLTEGLTASFAKAKAFKITLGKNRLYLYDMPIKLKSFNTAKINEKLIAVQFFTAAKEEKNTLKGKYSIFLRGEDNDEGICNVSLLGESPKLLGWKFDEKTLRLSVVAKNLPA